MGATAPVIVNGGFERPVRGSAEDFPSNYSGHVAGANQGRGEPFGWYLAPDISSDNFVRSGIAPPSPFLNNGVVPEGTQVAFIQGITQSLSQTVAGFQSGQEYDVSIRANVRNAGATPNGTFNLEIDGQSIISQQLTPVEAANNSTQPFYSLTGTYTPSTTGPKVVRIYQSGENGAINFDNLLIVEANAPAEIVAPAGPINLGITGQNEALTGSIIIDNIGGTDLNISGLSFDLGTFSVTSPTSPTFAIAPAASQTVNVEFLSAVAGVTTGTLTIESDDPVNGTVAIAFLANVVDEPVVFNPSFELDPPAANPGYTTNITGWTATGGAQVGINTQSQPFWDNGAAPDGTQVAFIQNAGKTLSTNVPGWVDGDVYRIELALNSRNFSNDADPPLEAIADVQLDGVTLVGFPVTATFAEAAGSYTQPWGRYSADVTISGDGTRVLSITNTQSADDNSLLIDDIRITRLGASHVVDWEMF